MRSACAILLSAIAIASCGRPDPGEAKSEWGCQPVSGLSAIADNPDARFILIGETVESNEAPNAIAAIACRLAERGESVLIGVTERSGGMTDAEAGLQRAADYLSGELGGQVSFAIFEQPDERLATRNRSASERLQADVIVAEADRIGVTRGVFLLPRSEATTLGFASIGERFSGYVPMAAHLPREQALSFVVESATTEEAPPIALHMFEDGDSGFSGALRLSSLTRAALPIDLQGRRARLTSEGEWYFEPEASPAETRAAREREAEMVRRVRVLAEGGEYGLPEYVWFEDE